MSLLSPRKLGISNRSIAKRLAEEKVVYVNLTIEEIKKNIPYKLWSEKQLQNALDLQKQSDKIHDKSIRLWEGIVKFTPFEIYNEIAALLVMDAFMRKNNMKLKSKALQSDLVDLYYWNIMECRRSVVRGKFLDELFFMINKKKTDDVWGFIFDYKEFVENVMDNIKQGKFTYEKEI